MRKNNVVVDDISNYSKEELKIWFTTNNKSGCKSTEKYLKKHYLVLYDKIIENSYEKNVSFLIKIVLFLNNIHEIPLCPQCNKKCTFKGSVNRGLSTFCSSYCSNKSDATRQKKINATKTEKYRNNIKNVNNKKKAFFLKKYGVDNPMKSIEIKNKNIKTNRERYGVNCVFKSDKIKEKIKKTNLKKYGFECSLQNEKIKEKSKQTNLKKYGFDSCTKTNEYKNRMKLYFLKKYGVEYPSQIKEIKEKTYNTIINKYGEIWVNHVPKYNPNSILYLDEISKYLNLPIQHALNGGEKKFIRYWTDGYIEKYNICIEWDENYHNTKIQKEKDIKKEQFIKENFNCKIFRINEKKFLKNTEENIKLVCNQINNIISSM